MRDLPRFPLNTVLFPGGTIPLQVFETRYIKMINECLDSDSNFGVVLIKEGKEVGGPSIPRSVGTIAKITSINQLPNNRLLVNSVGTQRFTILEIISDDPYMIARVNPENETVGEKIDDKILCDATQSTTNYLQALLSLQEGWVRNPVSSVPKNPVDLSFFMAQLLQQPVSEQQKMLETDSVVGRLQNCTGFMNSENQKILSKTKMELTLKFSRN